MFNLILCLRIWVHQRDFQPDLNTIKLCYFYHINLKYIKAVMIIRCYICFFGFNFSICNQDEVAYLSIPATRVIYFVQLLHLLHGYDDARKARSSLFWHGSFALQLQRVAYPEVCVLSPFRFIVVWSSRFGW